MRKEISLYQEGTPPAGLEKCQLRATREDAPPRLRDAGISSTSSRRLLLSRREKPPGSRSTDHSSTHSRQARQEVHDPETQALRMTRWAERLCALPTDPEKSTIGSIPTRHEVIASCAGTAQGGSDELKHCFAVVRPSGKWCSVVQGRAADPSPTSCWRPHRYVDLPPCEKRVDEIPRLAEADTPPSGGRVRPRSEARSRRQAEPAMAAK